jgi:hypothetical protein
MLSFLFIGLSSPAGSSSSGRWIFLDADQALYSRAPRLTALAQSSLKASMKSFIVLVSPNSHKNNAYKG